MIGQIVPSYRDIKMQLDELKNMYGWFYATCRLLRIHLNDRNIRQKVIHWGNTSWLGGREKAAIQLRVDVSIAAIGWIAGIPSTLPGRCGCPKNACITEALLNFAYRGTYYGCEIIHNGIKLDLSPRVVPERICEDAIVSRWCTGQTKILFVYHKCRHMVVIDSATISRPSGDWYVFRK